MSDRTFTPLNQIPYEQIVQLVEKFDVRGPRYTSYPTAPVWSNEFPAAPYLEGLKALPGKGRPIAVYLHLPYCQKRCLYCGCNSYISNDHEKIEGHAGYIEQEIRRAGEIFQGQVEHGWLHLGGGTPTHNAPDELARLIDTAIEVIPGAIGAERSVEVDPRVTTNAHLKTLADRGFRRISIGLQDLDSEVQKAVQREFSYDDMRDFIDRCRSFGFTGVNVDLIYGLPFQTDDTWKQTLDQVATLRPDRLAVFGYAHLPAKIKHQRAIKEVDLPGPKQRLSMLLTAFHHFVDHGYVSIGMDHFAVPEDKLAMARNEGTLWRNFMGYTTIRGLEMVGFGASAISELEGLFAQNLPLPQQYEEQIGQGGWATFRGHKLTNEDILRKNLINDLMCNLRVRIPEGADLDNAVDLYVAMQKLEAFEEDGLIVRAKEGWEVTPLGQLFVRNLAMPFDQYLPDQENVTFSRTV